MLLNVGAKLRFFSVLQNIIAKKRYFPALIYYNSAFYLVIILQAKRQKKGFAEVRKPFLIGSGSRF